MLSYQIGMLIGVALGLLGGIAIGVIWVRQADARSEYAKMKREFDEQHERVRKRIDEARSKSL